MGDLPRSNVQKRGSVCKVGELSPLTMTRQFSANRGTVGVQRGTHCGVHQALAEKAPLVRFWEVVALPQHREMLVQSRHQLAVER